MKKVFVLTGVLCALISMVSVQNDMIREDEVHEIVMSIPDELYEEIYLDLSTDCDHVTDSMIAEYYVANFK